MSKPASRWWTSSDGLRLHARDHGGGEGPARLSVIAIHGLTRNSRDFGNVAPCILARLAAYVGQAGAAIDTWADAADYARRTNAIAFPDRPQGFWDAFARRAFREDASGKPMLDEPEAKAGSLALLARVP